MIYEPLTDAITGNGTVEMSGHTFGGVLITADGTNDATIIVRDGSSTGRFLFKLVGKTPGAILMPIRSNSKTLYYSISGTNAAAMLYESVI